MTDSDSAVDVDDENDVPEGPINPMLELFPENWRTISKEAYEFWENRAHFFCPDGHRLLWPFVFGVRTIITIHKRIRNSGENLQPGENQGLVLALDDLKDQLRIMQIDIVQGPDAANAYAESIA